MDDRNTTTYGCSESGVLTGSYIYDGNRETPHTTEGIGKASTDGEHERAEVGARYHRLKGYIYSSTNDSDLDSAPPVAAVE